MKKMGGTRPVRPPQPGTGKNDNILFSFQWSVLWLKKIKTCLELLSYARQDGEQKDSKKFLVETEHLVAEWRGSSEQKFPILKAGRIM